MCGTRNGWMYVVAGVQNTEDGVAQAVCAESARAQAAAMRTSFFIDGLPGLWSR
jgi:hypothetical protein